MFYYEGPSADEMTYSCSRRITSGDAQSEHAYVGLAQSDSRLLDQIGQLAQPCLTRSVAAIFNLLSGNWPAERRLRSYNNDRPGPGFNG